MRWPCRCVADVNRRTLLKLPLLALLPVTSIAAPADPDALLVGDSHAFQLGPRLARAARARGRTVATSARGGSSARQWLELGWYRRAVERYPDAGWVFASLGTNCVKQERKRLAADLARLAAIRPLALLLSPTRSFDVSYITHAVVEATSEGAPITVIPHPAELELEHDLVHATDKGLRRWAELIAAGAWPQKARAA